MPTSPSGYNTNHALAIIPEVFRSPDIAKIDYLVRPRPSSIVSPPLTHLKTVFFGANDSCHAGGSSKQHVPLETFRQNLHRILSHPLILAHNPRIVLVTTPPADEHQLGDDHRPDGRLDKGRSAEHTRVYAKAAKSVGEELIAQGRQIVVCDLWTAMMARAGWAGETPLPGSLEAEKNAVFTDMLYDGT